MRTIICLFVFMVAAFSVKAQTGSIEGTITTSEGAPLASATVSLLKAADSSVQKLAVSDASGKYRFDGVKSGFFLVQASFTGYKTVYSTQVEVNGQNISIPAIALFVNASAQEMATVTSKKPFIEQKAGKTVMNVENSIMASGNTVMELIEKAPGVSVDKDDNINIRGRQGVIVLIDGKPQQLSAADLANMLRNMPGAQVETIEVITQASAKYDAAGNSGMINIRTKKLKKAGLNGNVTVAGAQEYYPRYSAGGNINYRKGKVNIFGNYNYGKRKTTQQLDLFREVKNGTSVTQFEQYAFSPVKRQSHTAKLGVDVQLGKNTSIGLVTDGFLASNKDINNYSRTKIGSGASVVDSSIEVTTNKIAETRNGSVSLNFRHRFGAKGGELSFDADRSFFERDGDEYLDNFYYLQFDKAQPHKSPLYLRNRAISEIGITVAKLDYSVSLGEKNGKLEAGLKHSRVKGDNNLRFDSLSNGNWVKDQSKTNHFLYDEMVNAAYVNYSGQFKKWELTTGLRAEQTISEGNSITLSNVVKRNYLQFFPSVFLSYAHSDNHQFSMAYSRRVQRPNYEKLNPFIFFLDQYTYQQGNPYLKPSVSDNMELSYTWKQFLTTTLGWQRITDPSITVTEQDDNTKVTYAIDRNLNTQHAYSFGLNAGLPVTKWWNTQNNAQAFYLGFKYQDAGNNLNAGQMAFQFNSSNSFTLGKGWSAEVNGSYQSRLRFGIFIVKPQWEIGAGVKKEIMKKRASIRFSVDDFFNTSISRVSTNYQNMNIRLRENSYNTIARLTFSMKFGKQDAQNRRRNAAAAEERSRLNTGGSR